MSRPLFLGLLGGVALPHDTADDQWSIFDDLGAEPLDRPFKFAPRLERVARLLYEGQNHPDKALTIARTIRNQAQRPTLMVQLKPR